MRPFQTEPLHPGTAAALLAASAAMLGADTLPQPLRAGLVIGYLLLAPGYAVLPSFGREHRLLHAILALCVGVSLGIGHSTLMAEQGWWRVDVAMTATVAGVVGLVAWRLRRDHSAPAVERRGVA